MMSIKKIYEDTDKYLLKYWFDEFKTTCYTYVEPLLDSITIDLIKHLCNALKQDSHVFIMSTDLLTQYILIQNSRNILIEDQLLAIICVIVICTKHVGEQSDMKPKLIAKLYENITDVAIGTDALKRMEMNILLALQCKLPLFSRIDDLKTFLVTYLQQFNLKVDITGLCVQILDLVYIYYRRLFFKLKNVYKQNPEALQAFKDLVTNRLYLPCGILICALELTKLKHFLNIQKVLIEICEMSDIHQNHVKLLGQYIYTIINSSGNNAPNF